jgi:hypothetical protein
MSNLHTAKQNLFLAALPEADYERLRSCLELVSLPEGWTVYEHGGELDLIYFPTTSVISLFAAVRGMESTAIAVVGNEGVFGISMLMGRKNTPSLAMVETAGYSYLLRAAHLRREFELGSPLRCLLQSHTQSLMTRIAQSAIANLTPAFKTKTGLPLVCSTSPSA